ncbi:DUF5011 domain-containing protein, partial [Vibrio toranzoniae]|uniref:DUF5011 domain-containing protein n=1 Tax=Vibrio toranzoniae TaxID=1194427 RepID=UPI001378C42A
DGEWLEKDIDKDGSKRIEQWSRTDGTGICPSGFRVPTMDELKAETISYKEVDDETTGAVKVKNHETAIKNFLKLPLSGSRENHTGDINYEGSIAYHIVTKKNGSIANVYALLISSADARQNPNASIAGGNQVRCFKTQDESNDTIAPIITLNGANTITLNLNTNYEELGAKAVDNVD